MGSFALEAQLGALERKNAELASEVGAATGAIIALESSLGETRDALRNTLEQAGGSLTNSHETVIKSYELQQEIDAIYERLKNMELANKEIRRCNNVKYYDFATYRKVRKIVQGIMDNMDFSMADSQIIDRMVEKQHLESPEYWLTALLIAIVAWISNQKNRANRALDQAMKLDVKKSASFMLVFNLRIGREDVAFHWFNTLLDEQLNGADKEMILLFFSMLSKTIEDDISDESRGRVSAYIRKQIADEITKSEDVKNSAQERVCGAFRSFADDFEFPYPLILKHATSAEQLKKSLGYSRNNANVINFITETINIDDRVRNEFLKQYIDKIIEQPCKVESKIYDEIERNELVIKFGGDREQAQNAFDETKLHDESDFDIISEMLNWVYTSKGQAEANPQMRKNMMILTRSIQQDAGDYYIQSYQNMFSAHTNVKIDDFEGSLDMAHPEASNESIESYYQGIANEQKGELKDLSAYVIAGVGVVLTVCLFFAIGAFSLLLTVVCLLVAGGIFANNMLKKKRIDATCEQNVQSVKHVCEEIGKEFKQLEASYRESDLLSATLQNKLAQL